MKYLLPFFILYSGALLSQNQDELNRKAKEEYMNTDSELKEVYHKILDNYGKDSIFIRHFSEANELWTKLRMAQVRMRFPFHPGDKYDPAQDMCVSNYMTELTRERINYLNLWLTGLSAESICNGSVKTQD